MTTMIILRGLPGSGKTTWANKFQASHPGTVICSADHFFESDLGYNYDPSKVGAAHFACRVAVQKALQARAPYVLVDNTHTRTWEYDKTCALALPWDGTPWAVTIYQHVCTGTWPSIHQIPEDTLAVMRQRFEPDNTLPHWQEDSEGCEFEQHQPHEWWCTTHHVLCVGSTQEPVTCPQGRIQDNP